MRYWNPVGAEVIDEWVRGLPLDAHSRVLDVGCGRAELLLRLCETHGCTGVGFDLVEDSIEFAQDQARRRLPAGALELRCEAFAPGTLAMATPATAVRDGAQFDLAACIGSTQAFGGYRETLAGLLPLVRPGGRLLIGEGYWRCTPAPEYLARLGARAEDYLSADGNASLARELGLACARMHLSTPEEWARYEDTYYENTMRFLAAHPDDPDAPALRERIEAWRAGYLEWGRHTLGFGLYLFEKAAA